MSKVYDQREETYERPENLDRLFRQQAHVFTPEQFKFLSDFADRQIELQRYRGAERPKNGTFVDHEGVTHHLGVADTIAVKLFLQQRGATLAGSDS